MTPRLSDLREPPVPGRFYLVPVIRSYPYCGLVGDWPVIGPKHEDRAHFNFPFPHYHVDARFVSATMERRLDAQMRLRQLSKVQSLVGAAPLQSRGSTFPKGRPQLKRLRCREPHYGYSWGHMEAVQALRADYGNPAQPIRRPDGRVLCPHRKVDLSQFPADADGVVTCPLHGLRVKCGEPAHV